MHGLSKMIEYMTMFGSAINFYGGPGEALHKSFVKAPGLKTQRRVSEFASQTAGQYYNVMAVKKAAKYVDIRAARERVREEHNAQNNNTANEEAVYTVRGGYTVDINPDKTVRVKSNRSAELEKHGLSEVLLQVMNRLSVLGYIGNRITGYTRAVVFGSDGDSARYNAHPFYHGGPWYDWAYVHYEIGEEDESTEEYYPSKILGFIKDDDEVKAVIQCSVDAVPWTELEENFVAPFELNTRPGGEEIVPMSSLCHPICVVPDYGATTLDNGQIHDDPAKGTMECILCESSERRNEC